MNFACISRGAAGIVVAVLIATTGCANVSPVSVNDANFNLKTRHTSVFNKISYRIPNGWVVIDGESDWVAQNDDKQFWAPGFDEKVDAYYVVSTVFPYLTMDDMSAKRVRSLEEISSATIHALIVASNATVTTLPVHFTLNGYDAVSFETSMNDTHTHYQIFVRLTENKVAAVAGNGPLQQRSAIRALVSAIAATVEPGQKK